MSWLDKFLQDQVELQGNLLGEAEASDIVIDNSSPQQLQAYKNLQDLIKERGGQQRTHQLVNADCVRHLLGTEPHELFKALGLPPSQRNRLPTEAQEALMCGNLAAFYAILEDQSAQGHNGIVRAARQGFSRAAEIFPWNWSRMD